MKWLIFMRSNVPGTISGKDDSQDRAVAGNPRTCLRYCRAVTGIIVRVASDLGGTFGQKWCAYIQCLHLGSFVDAYYQSTFRWGQDGPMLLRTLSINSGYFNSLNISERCSAHEKGCQTMNRCVAKTGSPVRAYRPRRSVGRADYRVSATTRSMYWSLILFEVPGRGPSTTPSPDGTRDNVAATYPRLYKQSCSLSVCNSLPFPVFWDKDCKRNFFFLLAECTREMPQKNGY